MKDAARILDSKGEEMSRSDVADIVTVMYMWKGASVGANMNAMFQNGRLINKAQFGLPSRRFPQVARRKDSWR